MNRRKSLGFTLTESAVVLGVAGVLTATAAPAMQGLLATRQVRDETGLLTDALRLARSEALRRDEVVTVCALAPQQADGPQCAAASSDWSGGWMVFVDRGRRGRLDADDLRLQVQSWPATRVSVTGTWPMISYRGTGVQYALSARFDVKAGGTTPLVVCVAKTGRPRVAPGTAC